MKISVLLALLLPITVSATELGGLVVGVSDGDTLKVMTPNHQTLKVRLVEIDAPEKDQAFGQKSKQSLSQLCFNKHAIIREQGRDKYQRVLGRVSCAGVDANAEQVKRGMAWAYSQYLTDQSIAAYQATAQHQGIGLWIDRAPIPPWVFRHARD